MLRLILSVLFSLIFASGQCASVSKPVASGNWEYINPSGIYIPYPQLETAINNTDIPGFDNGTPGAHGWNLENGKGTTAGTFYYVKGSSQQQQQQFMFYVFDSGERVESCLNHAGEKQFQITEQKGNLIYAEYTVKDSRLHCLILIENRILLQFTAYRINPDDLRKVVMNYDTSAFERLMK